MAELIDLPSWGLGTGDLIQQLALLIHLHKGDSELYKLVTGARVGYELYNRLSATPTVEQYETQCIMKIVDYVKKHPNASQADLAKEVQKNIEIFKAQVDAL